MIEEILHIDPLRRLQELVRGVDVDGLAAESLPIFEKFTFCSLWPRQVSTHSPNTHYYKKTRHTLTPGCQRPVPGASFHNTVPVRDIFLATLWNVGFEPVFLRQIPEFSIWCKQHTGHGAPGNVRATVFWAGWISLHPEGIAHHKPNKTTILTQNLSQSDASVSRHLQGVSS